MPVAFKAAPAKTTFATVAQTKNEVLFADYNMVQSEIRWVRNTAPYSADKEPVIDMFNNYFGGGMGALVFQTSGKVKHWLILLLLCMLSPRKKKIHSLPWRM